MFSVVHLKSTKNIGTLVYNACIHPSWRKSAKIGSFARLIDFVFLSLFFLQQDFPSWIDFIEDGKDFFKPLATRITIEF